MQAEQLRHAMTKLNFEGTSVVDEMIFVFILRALLAHCTKIIRSGVVSKTSLEDRIAEVIKAFC
jgi:hypothetical protein